MTDEEKAIRTIRALKWRCSKYRAKKIINTYGRIITKKYPNGLDTSNEEYFVLPGFEHVTKNQPVFKYNNSLGNWEIKAESKFNNPNTINK